MEEQPIHRNLREPSDEMKEKIKSHMEEMEYRSMLQNKSRARSITVGTAFGGIVEINVRSDFETIWVQMQPVEVIELIEQLAAGCGVEVAMRPKQNFSSWRSWEEVTGKDVRYESLEWKGTAPFQIRQQEETLEELERVKALHAAEDIKSLSAGSDNNNLETVTETPQEQENE